MSCCFWAVFRRTGDANAIWFARVSEAPNASGAAYRWRVSCVSPYNTAGQTATTTVRSCQRSQRSGGMGTLVDPSNTPAAKLPCIRVEQASKSMADPAMMVRESCSSVAMRRSETPASVAVKPSDGLRFAFAAFQGSCAGQERLRSIAPPATVISHSAQDQWFRPAVPRMDVAAS